MDKQPVPSRSPALSGLLALAVLYTVYLAAAIVLPILVAALLALVLSPLAARLKRRGVSRGVAAAVVTAAVVAGTAWGIQMLATPAAEWIGRAPQSLSEIEHKLRPVREPVRQVMEATEQVGRLAVADQPKSVVTVKQFDLGEVFVVSLTQLVAQAVIVVVLLFFLLASGERLIARAARVPRSPKARRQVVAVARRVKQDVSVYLGLITLVNAGLGGVTALVMWALDMPTPALWGALAGLMNFIPYAGSMVTLSVLSVVGLLSFDDVWRGLLPALAFLGLTSFEADFVTPTVVGRRLTLPPMLVFLSLVVWGWMWGVIGALLAVPILVILKVLSDHLPSLRPVAVLLGGREARRSLIQTKVAPRLRSTENKGKRA